MRACVRARGHASCARGARTHHPAPENAFLSPWRPANPPSRPWGPQTRKRTHWRAKEPQSAPLANPNPTVPHPPAPETAFLAPWRPTNRPTRPRGRKPANERTGGQKNPQSAPLANPNPRSPSPSAATPEAPSRRPLPRKTHFQARGGPPNRRADLRGRKPANGGTGGQKNPQGRRAAPLPPRQNGTTADRLRRL